MRLKFKTFLKVLPVFVIGFFIFSYFRTQKTKEVAVLPNRVVGEEKNTFESINGAPVSVDVFRLRPLAVIVDNHPNARPQFGLAEADIVYETLAEGGITRFLALYQSQTVEKIGSVRSAREYFAEIANEWSALFAHVGGSNEVITQIKQGFYKHLNDANEYYNFEFFSRNENKPEPHHIFTSTEKLRQLINFHKFSNTAQYLPWLFKAEQPTASSTNAHIEIDFSRAGYEVAWVYDRLINSYRRFQFFEPHIDMGTNSPIIAKTVVVQMVGVVLVPEDPLLSVDINLAESGRAIVFQDGVVTEGVWKKVGFRTRFYDSFGSEIKFNRGPIWLELVPKDKELNVQWQ